MVGVVNSGVANSQDLVVILSRVPISLNTRQVITTNTSGAQEDHAAFLLKTLEACFFSFYSTGDERRRE